LVTHNVAIASPIADFVVSLGLDGRILSQGSVSDALAKDHLLAVEVSEDREVTETADHGTDPAGPAKGPEGKLIVKEEIQEGRISWPACADVLPHIYVLKADMMHSEALHHGHEWWIPAILLVCLPGWHMPLRGALL